MKSYHLQIHCPVMAMTMADDAICTPKALNRFFDELLYAKITKQIVKPAEANVEKVGHLAFFKRKFADTLWLKVGDWFDENLIKENIEFNEKFYTTHCGQRSSLSTF